MCTYCRAGSCPRRLQVHAKIHIDAVYRLLRPLTEAHGRPRALGFHPSSRRSFLADLRADPAHRAEVLQGCLRRFEPRAAAAVACHCSSGPLEQREGKGKGFRPPKSRRCDTSHERNNHLIVHFEDKFKGSFFLFLFFFSPSPKEGKKVVPNENFIKRILSLAAMKRDLDANGKGTRVFNVVRPRKRCLGTIRNE